ncbi:MAG: glutaredoxin family protein [Planctomycetes bacterium]|nr:glutaredoxin family protein [Planctomycetota bacterium]
METAEGTGFPTQVIVYTKPDCPDCFNAKRYLNNRNVAYDTRDISLPEVVDELLKRLEPGDYPTPIIFAGDHIFFGFAANREHLAEVLDEMGL